MITAPIYVRSRQPLYMQAAGQLRLKIESRQWQPGSQIPIIEDLQHEFGLSRATIREALNMLEQEGLIARHRGRGTFVNEHLPERRSYVLPTRWADLISSLHTLKPEMVTPVQEEPGTALRDVQVGQVAATYTHFRRVHARNGEHYCLIDIHLRTSVFESDRERFIAKPVILILARRHRDLLSAVKQNVTFSIADKITAGALGIALGAPVVEIHRSIADADNVVVAHTYARYPGEYVRLDIDFDIADTDTDRNGRSDV